MQRIQASWWQPRAARRDRLLADARSRLGDVHYTEVWNEGSDLTFHAGVGAATEALQAVDRGALS